MVRHPAAAGTFYPAEKKTLHNVIQYFLQQTSQISPADKSLKILISPHAGLEYSGAVAAAGYSVVQKQQITRVVLLGASHRAYFSHAAVFSRGTWETPLGATRIDESAARKLLDASNGIIADDIPHTGEHTLEMQLIFLQAVLPDFSILPVLISAPSRKTAESLAGKLLTLTGSSTLVVVSSDLSHYPPYDFAVESDNQVIGAVETGNEGNFRRKTAELEEKYNPLLQTAACGAEAISVGLKLAHLENIRRIKKIAYLNSGDITGEKDRVVGYASIGFYKT